MKQFHLIANPHEDILEGKLTMDIFAANLWDVFNNRGPDEYKDADTFFKKTYETKGLKNLYNVVEKRIKGEGGDAVIQLQTPFGGGKTHALIGLYHKAKEWNANVFVFVGDKINPSEILIWEELEKQLTGEIKELKGKIVPSGEKIRQILAKKQPVILLIDELVEYLIPARGIKIDGSTLDSQILSFIKRLAEVVSSLDKCILVVTSPSRTQYSEEDQNLINLLSERLGRVEKSYTPVEEDEISSIIRKRLFSHIDEKGVKDLVSDVVDYFRKENILPPGVEPSEYKESFTKSYPFLPDVINCFYHRWGSFPTFQRTRGILRLLSLVLYNLKDQNLSYISLSDINLKDSDIRRELLKHIGNEFDSVISADITDRNSGSEQVNNSLGSSYRGLKLGTRCSTAIFLYSFSGGVEKGANMNEIKRSATLPSIPSSVVAEAVDLLKEKLFYLQSEADKILFTNKPNLNRALITKMENIQEKDLLEKEKEYIKSCIKESKFKTYLWPEQSNDIPDDTNLKLVILKEDNKKLMKELIENKGDSKRVNSNTIFFLSPQPKKQELINSIKRKIAYELLLRDSSLNLSEEQKRDIKKSIGEAEEGILQRIRDFYRLIYVPKQKMKFEEIDLGISTYGYEINLPAEVFEKLKSEGFIIDKIAPIALKEKYLKGKEYVHTKKIYESSLTTLGEERFLSKNILEEAIKEGVIQGIFGLGELKDKKIIPIYWKKEPTVGFSENEILIDKSICEKEIKEKEEEKEVLIPEPKIDEISKKETLQRLEFSIEVPKGKVADILRLLNFIQSKFDKVEIKVVAEEGEIDKEDYENKIKEALKQLGIEI